VSFVNAYLHVEGVQKFLTPCAPIIPYFNMKLLKPLITLPHPNILDPILKNWNYVTWLCQYGSQTIIGNKVLWNNPLHWTLVHYARKQLIKIKHAPIAIQVSKPSIHNESIINFKNSSSFFIQKFQFHFVTKCFITFCKTKSNQFCILKVIMN
jgi:hypothetical protein